MRETKDDETPPQTAPSLRGWGFLNRKRAWREAYLAKNKARRTQFATSPHLQMRSARLLTENLLRFFDDRFQVATAGAFFPTPTEPDVLLFVQVARVRGWKVFFPALEQDTSWAGAEPLWRSVGLETSMVVSPSLDVVLIPGIVFGEDGVRLGRGAGWYDRALTDLPNETVRVGVTFESQVVPRGLLPTHPWDQRVHHLITPRTIRTCR